MIHLGTVSKKQKVNGIFHEAGWVGPRCPDFPLKKYNMVLKHFILPVEHFKANLFFPIMTPPNPPNHSPSVVSGWGYQEG